MHNFVISSVCADIRRKHIIDEFSKNSIPFVFFDALTPSEKLDKAIIELCPSLHNSKLSPSEKGCLMSHMSLWKKCLDENYPYISIFEDDIVLSKNANLFLLNSHWVMDRFDLIKPFLIKMETFFQPIKQEKQNVVPVYNGYSFNILRSVHFGTAGYIISQSAAEYLLRHCSKLSSEDIEAIDELIFNKFLDNPFLTIYQLNPAICVQELQLRQSNSLLTSQIQEERKQTRSKLKDKRTLRQRLSRVKENLYRILTKHKRKKEKELEDEIKKKQSVPFL